MGEFKDAARIDIVSLATKLDSYSWIKVTNDEARALLSNLYGLSPNPENVETYAADVAEAELHINVVRASRKMESVARDKGIKGDALIGEVNNLLFSATQQIKTVRTDGGTLMQNYIDNFLLAGGASPIGTGFDDFDIEFGGFIPKHVHLLLGYSGLGKTTWALSVTRHVGRRQARTEYVGSKKPAIVLFSYEMTEHEIMQELTAMETGIWRKKLQSARLTQYELDDAISARDEIGNWNLNLYADSRLNTPEAIRRKLTYLLTQSPLSLVVIDGLWLMAGAKDISKMPQLVIDISQIAKDFNVPVLLLHQFNGGAYTAKKPSLDLIEYKGAVSNTVQKIWVMWRKEIGDDTHMHDMKRRGGNQTDEAYTFYYSTQYARYEEKPRHPDIAF
jgi:replicative DNA helicase